MSLGRARARFLVVAVLMTLTGAAPAHADTAAAERAWNHLQEHSTRVTARDGAIHLHLPLRPGEHVTGGGERFDGVLANGTVVDAVGRDRRIDPRVSGSYAPDPALYTSAGRGILVDSRAPVRFDVGHAEHSCLDVTIRAPAATVHVLRGTARRMLRRHAAVFGRAPRVPTWALGVWKTAIGGDRRVQADVQRLRQQRIPVDAVWVYDLVDAASGAGWPWPIYRPVPTGAYASATRTIARLHRAGVRVLGYLNPLIRDGAVADGARAGALLRDARGGTRIRVSRLAPGVAVRTATVDVGTARGRRWWRARVRRAMRTVAFDGAMLDLGEGAGAVDYTRASVEGAGPGKVLLQRSGGPGSQALNGVHFTGDQQRSWDRRRGLPSALTAMITGSLGGWPIWGPDIGGFTTAPADVRDERELWIRWVQLGALSPLMRDMLGAQRHAVDLWSDATTIATFRFYAALHQRLRPYLVALSEHAHRTGLPIVRAPFLVDPSQDAWTARDEYLLGDDLLVAPVIRDGARDRSVWLPRGRWIDAWTGADRQGGLTVQVAAPLDRIPLFVRATNRRLARALATSVHSAL